MDADQRRSNFLSNGMLVVLAIALAKFLLHCYFNNRYGYFRDEFDYMSCGDHLAWGYVDQPPLIPFLIRVSRAVLGDSLRAVRFLPALASSFSGDSNGLDCARAWRPGVRSFIERRRNRDRAAIPFRR